MTRAISGGASGGASVSTAPSTVKLELKTNQSCSDNSDAIVSWQSNSALWDPDVWFDFAGHPTRVTCPPGKAGKYFVACAVAFAAGASGNRGIDINQKSSGGTVKDSHTIRMTNVGVAESPVPVTATMFDMAEGDYLELSGHLLSAGTSLNMLGDSRTFLALIRIGDSSNLAQDYSTSAWHSADQTATTGVVLSVLFDSEIYQIGGVHSPSSNTSRFTAPVAGYYKFEGCVRFAANSTGVRYLQVKKSGTIIHDKVGITTPNGSNETAIVFSVCEKLAVGEFLEVCAFQDSGGNLSVKGGSSGVNSFAQFKKDGSGGGGGSTVIQCRGKVVYTTTTSISNGTDTLVHWGSGDAAAPGFNDDGMFVQATHDERLTVPAGKGGKFLVAIGAIWASNATGSRQCYLELIDGTNSSNTKDLTQVTVPANTDFGNGTIIAVGGNVMQAADGDYFRLHVFQSSGGSLNLVSSGFRTFMSAVRVGD